MQFYFFIYKQWSRCVKIPKQCGFGPYPRDPGLFRVPASDADTIEETPSNAEVEFLYVFYGMQKTCDFSGREFYALGRYNKTSHLFTLLDNRSDYANNAWDGGEVAMAGLNTYFHTYVVVPQNIFSYVYFDILIVFILVMDKY